MDKKRKAYAPFSLTSEAGVAQTPVEGYIDVNQSIYPTVNTGTINENGKWAGVKSDDEDFIGFSKAVAVGISGTVLFPDTNNHPSIDMTGFRTLQFAIKPSSGGDAALVAVFGPDTIRFANLEPVDSNAGIFFNSSARFDLTDFDNVLSDGAQALTANVWNIFTIQDRAIGQKNMQIRVKNDTGGNNDYEFAFRRLV